MSVKEKSQNREMLQRSQWKGEAQSRAHRYRRIIAISKRCSIFLGKNFPNMFPLTFVLGYPKSGTTWMCQLLADYLRLPFPQHSVLPIGCSAVVHSFEAPSRKYKKGVYIVRDGRDSVVSSYFHIRGRLLGGSKASYHKKMFRGLDPDAEPRDNMAVFFDRLVNNPTGGWSKLPGWGSHVGAFFEVEGHNLQLVKYEELLADGQATLSRAIEGMTGEPVDPIRIKETIERFSFQNQTGRASGQENRNSYLRKGQAGDWVNHFSRQAAERFDHRFGQTLIRAGYEPDNRWVNQT